MKKQFALLVALCCVRMHADARSKYVTAEEDNPYEFGFTIDGQQHRHEKKDANGVIQGEFGFITADGIYHVTVYATDENGNFRILSMRNVRISGPLDEPNAKLPDTSQFSKGQPSAAPNPLSINTTPAPAQTVQAVTQSNRFTTQSTIKPACAGCGYVTHATPLNKPENALSFQTQAGQNPRPQDVIIGHKPQVQHHSQGQSGVRPDVSSSSGFNAPPGTNAPFVSTPSGGRPNTHAPQNPQSPGSHAVGQFNPPNNYPDSPSGQSGPGHVKPSQNLPNQGQGHQQNYPGNEEQVGQSPSPQTPLGHSQETPQQEHTAITSPPLVQPQQPKQQPQLQQQQQPQLPKLQPQLQQQQQPQQHPQQQHNQDSLPHTPDSHPLLETQSPQKSTQSTVNTPQIPPLQHQPQSQSQPKPIPHTPNAHSDTAQLTGNNYQQPQQPQQPQQDPLLNPLTISNPPNNLDQPSSRPQSDTGISVSNGVINVPNNPPITIQDKFPNMVDGLPAGIKEGDITDLLYRFNYTVGFHGHYEKGYKNGAKVGGYFVNDRDGVSRIVTYVADENGYRPKVKFIRLDLNSDLVPKEGTEKTFGLKNFEFVWYPLN